MSHYGPVIECEICWLEYFSLLKFLLSKVVVIATAGLTLCGEVEEALREWSEQAASQAVAADPQLVVEGDRLPDWTNRMRAAIARTQTQA